MIINIMGGGPASLVPDLEKFLGPEDIWVGVDHGTADLLQKGIQPHAAFGDFDSVTEEELAEFETQIMNLKKYKPEKDETDMELALEWAIGQNPDSIRIFGATGGRIDHFLANVQLLEKYESEMPFPLFIIDKRNILFAASPGAYQVEKDMDKKYISFIPATMEVSGLTLEGFKYPLQTRRITKGSTLCISNELIGDSGTFSFSEGILIVIRSND